MSQNKFAGLRTAMRKSFPELMDLTENFLLGDIWKRPGLTARDRSLVTITALIATNKSAELKFHLRRAIENGVTLAEIKATIMHLAFYAGWPCAMTAVHVVMEEIEGNK